MLLHRAEMPVRLWKPEPIGLVYQYQLLQQLHFRWEILSTRLRLSIWENSGESSNRQTCDIATMQVYFCG